MKQPSPKWLFAKVDHLIPSLNGRQTQREVRLSSFSAIVIVGFMGKFQACKVEHFIIIVLNFYLYFYPQFIRFNNIHAAFSGKCEGGYDRYESVNNSFWRRLFWRVKSKPVLRFKTVWGYWYEGDANAFVRNVPFLSSASWYNYIQPALDKLDSKYTVQFIGII